jgi:hypothetical protein
MKDLETGRVADLAGLEVQKGIELGVEDEPRDPGPG